MAQGEELGEEVQELGTQLGEQFVGMIRKLISCSLLSILPFFVVVCEHDVVRLFRLACQMLRARLECEGTVLVWRGLS